MGMLGKKREKKDRSLNDVDLFNRCQIDEYFGSRSSCYIKTKIYLINADLRLLVIKPRCFPLIIGCSFHSTSRKTLLLAT